MEYGISERHYKDVFIRNGFSLEKKVNKFPFNEDYFEKIDTEDKAYFLGFIVADNFITEYYSKLVKCCALSGNNKIRCPKGTYYVVDWGGLSDVEKIHDFLYKDATVFLKRKKETFDRVVSITKDKNKYRK